MRSILIGISGLGALLLFATVLTISRTPIWTDTARRERTTCIFLAGLAVHCLHFLEEFLGGFEARFPKVLGQAAWSETFFVGFNLVWLSIWLVAALGLLRGYRLALIPMWFFALASVSNGFAHPVLALVTRSYFPGLLTSPVAGVFGVWLCRNLYQPTAEANKR